MAGRIKNHFHDEIVRQDEIRRNNERCHPLSPDRIDPTPSPEDLEVGDFVNYENHPPQDVEGFFDKALDAPVDEDIEPFIDITESVPAPTDLNGWKERIGDYVKFVDEQAVVEAIIAETQYPTLFIGKLDNVFLIKIYQDEILYARIKPMWSDEMQYIPCSNVRFAD